jgi:hypothetical protein
MPRLLALAVLALLAGCAPANAPTPAGSTAMPPAEGRFQLVSQAPWPGEKVRVFFLGAQF